MNDWTLDITDADVDAALEAGKTLPERPSALSAEYNGPLDVVVIRLNDGQRLVIPREQLQGLEDASEAQLTDIEVFAGVNIGWRQLNVDHYLPTLMKGSFSTEKWKHERRGRTVAA